MGCLYDDEIPDYVGYVFAVEIGHSSDRPWHLPDTHPTAAARDTAGHAQGTNSLGPSGEQEHGFRLMRDALVMEEREQYEKVCEPWFKRLETDGQTSNQKLDTVIGLLRGYNGDPGVLSEIRELRACMSRIAEQQERHQRALYGENGDEGAIASVKALVAISTQIEAHEVTLYGEDDKEGVVATVKQHKKLIGRLWYAVVVVLVAIGGGIGKWLVGLIFPGG